MLSMTERTVIITGTAQAPLPHCSVTLADSVHARASVLNVEVNGERNVYVLKIITSVFVTRS